MKCPECGAATQPGAYHTRPDNLAACTGPKAKAESKPEPDDKPKTTRKPRTKK